VPQSRLVLQFQAGVRSRLKARIVVPFDSVDRVSCPATPLTRLVVLQGWRLAARTHESMICMLPQLLSKHYVVQLLLASYEGYRDCIIRLDRIRNGE